MGEACLSSLSSFQVSVRINVSQEKDKEVLAERLSAYGDVYEHHQNIYELLGVITAEELHKLQAFLNDKKLPYIIMKELGGHITVSRIHPDLQEQEMAYKICREKNCFDPLIPLSEILNIIEKNLNLTLEDLKCYLQHKYRFTPEIILEIY